MRLDSRLDSPTTELTKTIFVTSFLYVGKREIHEHNNFSACIPLNYIESFLRFSILWFNIMIGL